MSKITIKIDLINATIVAAICVILFLTVFLIARGAVAQTPIPDIDLTRQGSTYMVTCQPTEPIDKMIQMCTVRTDLADPVELGCENATTLEPVSIVITVARTPHIDGMIRCYAVDSEGNVSDLSDNAGVTDFTPNGKPVVKK